ncbi:MAG: NTP transferase domain-containing protein [Opitutales bacterium]
MSQSSTLIILAAGMGSRFGGPKQIAGVGPSGETLLEYGLFDAASAGFTKFVFVIREAIQEDFEQSVLARFNHKLNCSYILQSIDDLPNGVDSEIANSREKPWGTAHAFWTARTEVEGPCAVINADDFYGSRSFRIMKEALDSGAGSCLVPFRLDQTLSPRGGVSRGVCHMNGDGDLVAIQECRDLVLEETGTVLGKDNTSLEPVSLSRETPVSMNLMGFSAEIWPFLDANISSFFREHLGDGSGEYGLPDLLTAWMRDGKTAVRPSPETWLGITHSSDLEAVQSEIKNRIQNGDYPETLWA